MSFLPKLPKPIQHLFAGAAAMLVSGSLFAFGTSGSSFDLSDIAGNLTAEAGSSVAQNTCSDAGMQTITQFCYDSGFPLRIAGQTTISGSDLPEPPGATRQSTCKCSQFFYGTTRGMWLPTRMVEVVRKADCSPVYGKTVQPMLAAMAKLAGTGQSEGVTQLTSGEAMLPHETGFRHYHSWSFPFNPYNWNPRCFHKGENLETSVSSFTWSKKDPVYMNMLYPEWMAIGNMVNSPLFDLAAHSASCIANTTGLGTMMDDHAYWLGGCQDNSLPAAGSYSSVKNSLVATATILNRSLMHSNRSGGFASVSTVGDKALCTPVGVPYPSKSEFKATMMFPYPESGSGGGSVDTSSIGQLSGEVASFLNLTSRCAHSLGSSYLRWGLGKSDQALSSNDSDAVYLLWRWVDCCQIGGVF